MGSLFIPLGKARNNWTHLTLIASYKVCWQSSWSEYSHEGFTFRQDPSAHLMTDILKLKIIWIQAIIKPQELPVTAQWVKDVKPLGISSLNVSEGQGQFLERGDILKPFQLPFPRRVQRLEVQSLVLLDVSDTLEMSCLAFIFYRGIYHGITSKLGKVYFTHTFYTRLSVSLTSGHLGSNPGSNTFWLL